MTPRQQSLDVSDLVGLQFEVSIECGPSGKVVHTARALDPIGSHYAELVVEDGVVKDRINNSNELVNINLSSYCHAVLDVDSSTGLVTFTNEAYLASPYPSRDIDLFNAYEHKAENKFWAITSDAKGNLFSIYRSEQTKNRVIYRELGKNKSASARSNEKLAKGYTLTANKVIYVAKDRNIIF